MSQSHAVLFTWYLQPLLALVGLIVMWRGKSLRKHIYLSSFLCAQVVEFVVLFPLYKRLGGYLTPIQAYAAYFYTYWFLYAVEACLIFLCVQSMFKMAMEPLKGLRRMGLLAFRWAAGVSLVLAFTSAIATGTTGAKFVLATAAQLQRGENILILCLLLFLCLAAKPLGLNYSNRVFGVSLGFGIMAASDFVVAAFISESPHTMVSWISLLHGAALAGAMVVWVAYFAVPEPRRKLVTLPLRSPLLRWNDIAMALNDREVHTAIGLVPEMFADEELKMIEMMLGDAQRAS